MKAGSAIQYGLGLAILFLYQERALPEVQHNGNAETRFCCVVANDSGTRTAMIKMSPNDALRVLEELYWIDDPSFREKVLNNGILKITGQSRAQAIASLESKKHRLAAVHAIMEGTIDRAFQGQGLVERDYLKIRLPKDEAIEVLKAAAAVGDSQLRYQVMRFGLARYKGTDLQEEVIAFLAQVWEAQEGEFHVDILFIILEMDLSSKNSLEILRKASSIKGDDRESSFVRNFAKALLEYQKSGDPKIIEPYTFRGALP